MKAKRLYWLLICLLTGATRGNAGDLSVTTIVERVYYPDLPIYVTFTVMNTATNPVRLNSVGHGTPWVRAVLSRGQESLETAHVQGVRWRDSVELEAGATMTGRIDVANFLAATHNGTNGLPPGEYQLTLCYQFGSNATDFVKSTPQSFRIREPERELYGARRDYQMMRQTVVASTNLVPASLNPAQVDTTNPYSVALRVHYARWLSRRGRFSESLSFWKHLLLQGDTFVTDNLETKEEIAQCYIRLKQPEKAQSILREISSRSDSAFGMLRILDRRTSAEAPK